ncbi:MAG TPA: hypothetical protein DCL61_28280 [Cyanobacteria bacterium UBA12227]|nr:hypothetical protein [Cyanobacteria bacterium UBA12227]
MNFGFWISVLARAYGIIVKRLLVVGCWLLVVGKLKTQNSKLSSPLPTPHSPLPLEVLPASDVLLLLILLKVRQNNY